jgi:hypothetical protein
MKPTERIFIGNKLQNHRDQLASPAKRQRAGTGDLTGHTSIRFIFIATMIATCIIAPAMAGTKYMSGSPELSAAILGTNEFTPGDDATITVIIQNSGLNEWKFSMSGIVDRDDLPNTAKLMTVTLNPGTAPVTVKSDPQMVGDLKGGSSLNVNFNTKIANDAPTGTYNLPLEIRYTYLYTADQYGQESIQYYYQKKNATIMLPVKIKPELKINVISAVPEHLNVGTEGYLNIRVINTGSESGKSAIVKIVRNGNSPVIPSESSVFIGDFSVNATVDCRYKVSVSKDAEGKTYPVDVFVNYVNYEGDTVDSEKVTVGVPVGNKIDFAIVSEPTVINPGTRKVISIEYQNSGGTTVYSAQARISAVDPFTSNDDTAFLGDLAPGQKAVANFEVAVDKGATIKEYGLDSEIRYRDALSNSLISDTMKVRVDVVPQSGLGVILGNPIVMTIIIAALIGTGYAVYRYRRKAA